MTSIVGTDEEAPFDRPGVRGFDAAPGPSGAGPAELYGGRRALRDRRVAWLASAYGFGDDLAYYQQVFAEFVRRFPRTVIHVVEDYPVSRYPDLPLRADFAFRVFHRHKQLAAGLQYAGRLRLPSPRTALRILREDADVRIVIEFTPTALLSWATGRLRRKRVLLLVESDPTFRGSPPKPLVSWFKRQVARRAHAVLTSNEHGRRYLDTVLRLPADKIVVGPYLTSDPGVQGAPSTTGPIRLLFLNTVSRRKGVTELLEALAGLPDELSQSWTLDIVGSGELDDVVSDLVGRLELTDRVILHGRVPWSDVNRFYATTDVVVCPTLRDYRSLAGIEAVNAGKGVLVSVYDGAADELVQHAPAAWTVDPLDPRAFRAVLSELLTDPGALRGRLSLAANPPEAFSVASVGDALERAVEKALR